MWIQCSDGTLLNINTGHRIVLLKGSQELKWLHGADDQMGQVLYAGSPSECLTVYNRLLQEIGIPISSLTGAMNGTFDE